MYYFTFLAFKLEKNSKLLPPKIGCLVYFHNSVHTQLWKYIESPTSLGNSVSFSLASTLKMFCSPIFYIEKKKKRPSLINFFLWKKILIPLFKAAGVCHICVSNPSIFAPFVFVSFFLFLFLLSHMFFFFLFVLPMNMQACFYKIHLISCYIL